MTKQLQSDLAELENLEGIRIALSDDAQSFFVAFSYRQKGDKAFAFVCWAAVAILYGICGLALWWAASRI